MILSGITTTAAKAAVGLSAGVAFSGLYLTYSLIMNPRVFSMINLKAASARATTARRKGLVEVGNTKIMGEFNSRGSGYIERTLFEGAADAMAEGGAKKKFEAGVRTIASAVYGNVRILAAMDAFMGSISGDLYGAHALKQDAKNMGIPLKKYMKDLKNRRDGSYKSIAKEEYDVILEDANDSADKAIADGVIPSSGRARFINNELSRSTGMGTYGNNLERARRGFISKRAQEISENERYDSFIDAVAVGQWASLVGTPDGYIGRTLSNKVAPALSIQASDEYPVVAAKLVGNAVFKFVNLFGNIWNESWNAIPVIGIINQFIGPGYNSKTGNHTFSEKSIFLSKYEANPTKFWVRLGANLMTSGVALMVLADQYELEEDDEGNNKWVLDKNRKLDIRVSGWGNWHKNSTLAENFGMFELGVRTSSKNEFTYSQLPQYSPHLMMVMSIVGAMTELDKGIGTSAEENKNKSKDRDKIDRFFGALTVGSYEALQGFLNQSFNSVGRITKRFQYSDDLTDVLFEVTTDLVASNLSPIWNPSIIREGVHIVRGLNGMSAQDTRKPLDKMFPLAAPTKKDIFNNEYKSHSYWTPEKMAKDYPETQGLLYKYADGTAENQLNLTKNNFAKYRGNKDFNVYTYAYNFMGKKIKIKNTYVINSKSDFEEEARKLHREFFGEIMKEDYFYNKNLSLSVLEKQFNKSSRLADDMVRTALVEKYFVDNGSKGIRKKVD
jgi:hypothetical protein